MSLKFIKISLGNIYIVNFVNAMSDYRIFIVGFRGLTIANNDENNG